MSDITISFKGDSIATMDTSGTKNLLTKGKYCEDDIEVTYVKPGGGTTTYSLIGSGSYTKEDTAANMYIPVTYNGTPKMVAIEADSEVSGTMMTVLVVNALDLFADLPTYENSFDNNCVGKAKAKKADDTYSYSVNNTVYLSDSTTIFAGRPSTNYPWIQNVKYNWYIYGIPASSN